MLLFSLLYIYNLQQKFLSFILSHFLSNSCKISCSDAYFIIRFILKRSFEFEIRRFKALFLLLPYNLPRCVLKPFTGLANSLKSKVSSYSTNPRYGGRGVCPSEWYGANGLLEISKKIERKFLEINIRITKYS